ncbi:MAG TPA: hypothetical protein PL123_01305 [Bacteroidales bacterium]|nr:hypothetical protein [Bacteroidales bacterium]
MENHICYRETWQVSISPPSKGGETITTLFAFAAISNKKNTCHLAGLTPLFISFLAVFFFLNICIYSQPADYSKIFGTDWEQALKFEKENRLWMEKAAEENKVPYNDVIAVIFPELVRYSALRDKMEITVLKALYINLGDQYANFSIGRFQVKPSFAEYIRKESSSRPKRRSVPQFPRPEDFSNLSDYRKSIVTDLESPEREFLYIIAFYRICEKKFDLSSMNEKMKIRFLATAYNYGINKKQEEIEKMTDKKYFNTRLFKTENYSYSDVALFWYENFSAADKSVN